MMSKTPIDVYKKLKSTSVRIAISATPFKFGEKDKVQKHQVKGIDKLSKVHWCRKLR